MKYVIGFLFRKEDDLTEVLLIHKTHGPKYVVDKLNGLGGSLEMLSETPLQAMEREAAEEGNVHLSYACTPWQQFHYEAHKDGKELHFFVAAANNEVAKQIRTCTDEVVSWANVADVLDFGRARVKDVSETDPDVQGIIRHCVPNLSYLIPMARHWLIHPSQHYSEQEPLWTSARERMPPPGVELLVAWGEHRAVDTAHTHAHVKWKHPSHPLGYLIQGHPGSHNDVTDWMLRPTAPDKP
jgi:8-oxo-dGTP pyrophosphatase MutT (NUDIX family)